METIINQSLANNYTVNRNNNALQLFFEWAKQQENNRFLWLGISIALHGCMLTPLTGIAVMFSGANLFLFLLVTLSMTIVLVVNLAAQPTKVTIPVFLLSIIIDMIVFIICLFNGLI